MLLNRIIPISAALASSVAFVSSAYAQAPSVTITSITQTVTASNPTSRDISVSANAFAGASGYIGFVLVRNDTNAVVYSQGFSSNTNILSYSKVIPNVSGGEYTLNVYANTGAPNYTQTSQSSQVSVPVSNGSPVVSITSVDQVVTAGNSTSKDVTINGTALPGASGALQYIGFVLQRLDNGAYVEGSVSPNSSGVYSKTFTNVSAGTYVVRIFANTGAPNYSQSSASWTITVTSNPI
jgi:hypothetical protein